MLWFIVGDKYYELESLYLLFLGDLILEGDIGLLYYWDLLLVYFFLTLIGLVNKEGKVKLIPSLSFLSSNVSIFSSIWDYSFIIISSSTSLFNRLRFKFFNLDSSLSFDL